MPRKSSKKDVTANYISTAVSNTLKGKPPPAIVSATDAAANVKEKNRRNIAKAIPTLAYEDRAKYETKEAADEGQRRHALKWHRKNSAFTREIGPYPLSPIYAHPSGEPDTTYSTDTKGPGYISPRELARRLLPFNYLRLPTIVPTPSTDDKIVQIDAKGAKSDLVTPKSLIQVGGIWWERRLACKKSLQLFCETYLEEVFYLDWSEDQLKCLQRAEMVCSIGGKFALAMPRAGGKTAIVRAATLWASLYGYKHFIYNIGATEPKSTATIGFVSTQLSYNPKLHQDFPELCWPIIHLQGTNRTAGGQLFFGEPTHVHLGAEEIRFPTLILPKEYVAHYKEHDPDSIQYTKHLHQTIPSNSLVYLRSSGITGSIRGEAEADPITLKQPRPDLAILDDVQKDSTADSPMMCEKLIRLIDGAVTGLSGGGQHVDCLMPCTVIREGDAADTYIDPLKKPDWLGERCAMVKSWPPGITDFEITQDTEAGKLWNQYAELRRTGLRDQQSVLPATNFYADPAHRSIMDEGFHVSWAQRYDRRTELSAQQNAMNLRLQLGSTFLSEYQNIGRQLIETSEILITAKQLQSKMVDTSRREMLPGYQKVVTHIDVQNEILFYLTFACDMDFNGTFIDYGTWPEITLPYFTKAQTESWSLLTNAFFQFPDHAKYKTKAYRSSSGKVRAPLEPKIYFALSQLVPILLQRQYKRLDETKRPFQCERLGIDTRWGQASEVIKRYIRESGHQNIVPYYGDAMPPTRKQFEEYELRENWLFEQQVNPLVREPKWVMRPNPDGMWYMQADVNRLKDFLFSRLSVPMGASGCISIHKAPSEYHELFVHHICSSEYPEPLAARGLTKNQWTKREGTAYDNDYLDCAAACMALAGTLGVSVKTSDYQTTPIRRRLSEVRDAKQRRNNASHPTNSPPGSSGPPVSGYTPTPVSKR